MKGTVVFGVCLGIGRKNSRWGVGPKGHSSVLQRGAGGSSAQLSEGLSGCSCPLLHYAPLESGCSAFVLPFGGAVYGIRMCV